MAIHSAFFLAVLIWGSMPLAIQWSLQGVGIFFALMGRMSLGLLLSLLLITIKQIPMPWHKQAIQAYIIAGVGFFITMILVYFGAKTLPSGWVSVLYGLQPLVTGILAAWLLHESFGWSKRIGLLISLSGLATIFIQSMLQPTEGVVLAILSIMAGLSIDAATMVLVKRQMTGISPVAMTTGALIFSVPLLVISWFIIEGGVWPEMNTRVFTAILYLGVIGSFVGLLLFYYVLNNMAAGKTALMTLLTPLVAITLGITLNNEALTSRFIYGTFFILLGVLVYQWGENLIKKIDNRAR
ncbi:DMT family transporter [Magnetococcales bacterium HHB-1]